MIACGEIEKFLRLEGWVTVGCDRIRLQEGTTYQAARRHKNKVFDNWIGDINIDCYVKHVSRVLRA
jgi:hypothetical protein